MTQPCARVGVDASPALGPSASDITPPVTGDRYSGGLAPVPPPAPPAAGLQWAFMLLAAPLQTRDCNIVLPKGSDDVLKLSFPGQPNVPFKLILHPSAQTGGFRKAKGKGTITLKCNTALQANVPAIMRFWLGIANNPHSGGETFRGPFTHDFSQSSSLSMPDVWNFKDFVDNHTQKLWVFLKVDVIDDTMFQ